MGRTTHNLKIQYYVKQDFSSNFAGDLRRIERQVEEEYVSNLRTNCWKERSYSKSFSIIICKLLYYLYFNRQAGANKVDSD